MFLGKETLIDDNENTDFTLTLEQIVITNFSSLTTGKKFVHILPPCFLSSLNLKSTFQTVAESFLKRMLLHHFDLRKVLQILYVEQPSVCPPTTITTTPSAPSLDLLVRQLCHEEQLLTNDWLKRLDIMSLGHNCN